MPVSFDIIALALTEPSTRKIAMARCTNGDRLDQPPAYSLVECRPLQGARPGTIARERATALLLDRVRNGPFCEGS